MREEKAREVAREEVTREVAREEVAREVARGVARDPVAREMRGIQWRVRWRGAGGGSGEGAVARKVGGATNPVHQLRPALALRLIKRGRPSGARTERGADERRGGMARGEMGRGEVETGEYGRGERAGRKGGASRHCADEQR